MYPVNLKMKGIPCLVIGGGHIAVRKVKKLLLEDAEVTVLAPEISPELMQYFREKRISWQQASYRKGDAKGDRFVYCLRYPPGGRVGA